MNRVVLLDPAGQLDTIELALAQHPDVEVERADVLPTGSDVIAVLVPPEIPVGGTELERLPNLRIAATTSTGFDHLDLDAISAAGAWATYCPGYCDEEVADHTIAFAVALLRGLVELNRTARQGIWDQAPAPPRRLAGTVLGIVGLGRIGRAVARRGAGLGMSIVAHDPMLGDGGEVELVTLDELLSRAEVITLHALLTPTTRAMVGPREFELMRPGAYFINCARAALVDHAALGEALRSGRLGGCALDVLPLEPPPADEPAFDWPRTVRHPSFRLVLAGLGDGAVPDRGRGGGGRARGA